MPTVFSEKRQKNWYFGCYRQSKLLWLTNTRTRRRGPSQWKCCCLRWFLHWDLTFVSPWPYKHLHKMLQRRPVVDMGRWTETVGLRQGGRHDRTAVGLRLDLQWVANWPGYRSAVGGIVGIRPTLVCTAQCEKPITKWTFRIFLIGQFCFLFVFHLIFNP